MKIMNKVNKWVKLLNRSKKSFWILTRKIKLNNNQTNNTFNNKLTNLSINNINMLYKNYMLGQYKKDNKLNNVIYKKENKKLIFNNKSIVLKNIKDKNKLINFFNKNISNTLSSKVKKSERINIIENRSKDIESRKISNKLSLPHYYFTPKYNEKSMPTQIRHWTTSIYNFIKDDRSGIRHKDLYVSQLIKLFFNIKYIKRRKIFNTQLLDGYKITPNNSIVKSINKIMRYTSNRTSSWLREVNNYPSALLTFKWIKDQIEESMNISKLIKERKLNKFGSYFPKKKRYIRELGKILLSKPLFKHTPHNLIIDLFIFTNKTYKYGKIKDMIRRRSLYKYIYSLYYNYNKKIENTLNRPRFFYINLIEPKTYTYYKQIIKSYENILIKNNKSFLIYLILLIFKWNNTQKTNLNNLRNQFILFKSNITNKIYNNVQNNNIISNKKYTYKKNLLYNIKNKNNFDNNYDLMLEEQNNTNMELYDIYKNIVSNNKKDINMNNNFVNMNNSTSNINKKRKKGINNIKPSVLNKNSMDSVNYDNENNVILWSNKDMNNRFNIESNINNKRVKKFGRDKFSFNHFKKKNLFVKGKKRKISSRVWKQKLMSYYSFSKLQKKDTGSKLYHFNKMNKNKNNEDKEYSQYINELSLKKSKNNKNINTKLSNYNNLNNKLLNNSLNYNDESFNNNTIHIGILREIYPFSNKEYFFKNGNKNLYIIKKDFPFFNKKYTNKKLNVLNMSYNEYIEYKKSNNILVDIKNVLFKDSSHKELNLNNLSFNKEVKETNNLSIKINETELKTNNKITNKKLIISELSNNDNIINTLFTQFYFLNNTYKHNTSNYNLNKVNINKLINDKDLSKRMNKFVSLWNKSEGKFNYKFNNNNINKYLNSKHVWDDLDISIIELLSNIFKFNKYEIYKFKQLSVNSIINNIHELINNNSILYLKYYMYFIKKEFYKINRDVLISNIIDIKYNEKDKSVNSYYALNNINKDKGNTVLYYGKDNNLEINIWQKYFNNNREEYMENNLPYNEKLFKLYYRNMIPLFIYKSYKSFINYLGYNNIIMKGMKSLISKTMWFKNNNLIIYNYIVVKTLLELLHYNYRSLIRLDLKYYYINKLRYYDIKYKRLQINSWTTSIRYIKRLKKAPRYFWKRYHNLASYFYKRIVQNAELDTKRKIFVPFVLYFEDILYTIYNKSVLLRLWPLKKFFLSSYILADRILTMALWKENAPYTIKVYRKYVHFLVSLFKLTRIKKSYDYYTYNNSNWPKDLKNIINKDILFKNFTYNSLEYYHSKTDRYHTLNTYPLYKNYISDYLLLNENTYQDIKNKMKSIRFGITKRHMNNIQFVYLWSKPLQNYIKDLRGHFDINGIKFKLTGRSGMIRSNMRRFSKYIISGNLSGSKHITLNLNKPHSISIPYLRGTIRSNFDYSCKTMTSRNGCITLKVWISTILGSDIHELYLYLLKIKNLYSQLINRYYLVHPYYANIKNYYLIDSVKEEINNNILKKNKMKDKRKLLKHKYKFKRKKYSFIKSKKALWIKNRKQNKI